MIWEQMIAFEKLWELMRWLLSSMSSPRLTLFQRTLQGDSDWFTETTSAWYWSKSNTTN